MKFLKLSRSATAVFHLLVGSLEEVNAMALTLASLPEENSGTPPEDRLQNMKHEAQKSIWKYDQAFLQMKSEPPETKTVEHFDIGSDVDPDEEPVLDVSDSEPSAEANKDEKPQGPEQNAPTATTGGEKPTGLNGFLAFVKGRLQAMSGPRSQRAMEVITNMLSFFTTRGSNLNLWSFFKEKTGLDGSAKERNAAAKAGNEGKQD